MSTRARFGKVLRRWADRIDAHHPADRVPTVLIVDGPSTDPIQQAFNDAVDRFQVRRGGPGRGADGPPAVLEERIPADLNPWAGAAVLSLHNHTAEEACDDTCTTYEKDT